MTTYSYGNGDGDLTGIAPPSGSSLGARHYTWDGFDRLATATDGNGATISFRWASARDARLAVFKWITRYNTCRRHSYCGHLSLFTCENTVHAATLQPAA